MKQSLVLLIFAILINALLLIPILGWILYPFASLAIVIFFIIGIINALGGQEKELPIIGTYSKSLSI